MICLFGKVNGRSESGFGNSNVLFIPPLTPTLSTPAGAERELNSPIWPTLGAGWSSCADRNIQTSREPGTVLNLSLFILKVGLPI